MNIQLHGELAARFSQTEGSYTALFVLPIAQPRPRPLLLKCLSRRQPGLGKEAREHHLMPTLTPSDGRQRKSLMLTGICSDGGTKEKVVKFGVGFHIRIPNFDIKLQLAQDCRNFGFWRGSSSVNLSCIFSPCSICRLLRAKIQRLFKLFDMVSNDVECFIYELAPAASKSRFFLALGLFSFYILLVVLKTMKMFEFWRTLTI